mmetsp:Transcript_26540/g.54767  ORF Transcript_26540/g.54767 Transcript_26540/m.54767 type:complete len:257 (+) Transcript_26540:428-1198(+)
MRITPLAAGNFLVLASLAVSTTDAFVAPKSQTVASSMPSSAPLFVTNLERETVETERNLNHNHNNDDDDDDDDENNSEGPKLAGRPPCSSPEGRCTGPPLHAACRIHGSRAETPAGTLRLPVSPNPRALRQPGPRRPGSLPLHLLCDSFSSLRFRCATTTATVSPPPPKRHDALELLRVLLASHPRATSVPDRRGRLPLHRAVLAGAPFEAVRMLVHRDPRAIALPDRDGLTPLAHAKKVYPVGGSVPKLLELAWV